MKSGKILYAVAPCSYGSVLVAASDAGICSTTLGDDPQELIGHLQKRFPETESVRQDGECGKMMNAVINRLEHPAADMTAPLDLRGTAFQRAVWKALGKIPLGQTATYAQIARKVGKPKAVRAVAQACAANPVAIAIPCHRVVRSDGSLSGYRWGVERKRELLKRESEIKERSRCSR